MSNANRPDLEHINRADSQISQYWREELEKLEKNTAVSLLHYLNPSNALGLASSSEIKRDSMMACMIGYKLKYPNKVILCQCGEFYETYGVDALMMIAYAGE